MQNIWQRFCANNHGGGCILTTVQVFLYKKFLKNQEISETKHEVKS
jgi:hypothetical protein